MTSTPATPEAPFTHIKVRTAALVFCGNEVALIRRNRADSTHYTPPGGPALAALADPRAVVADAALNAVTDENYTWV